MTEQDELLPDPGLVARTALSQDRTPTPYDQLTRAVAETLTNPRWERDETARAAVWRARRGGVISEAWGGGRALLAVSHGPNRQIRGPPGRPYEASPAFVEAELRTNAPELAQSIQRARDRSPLLGDFRERAEMERWYDTLLLMDRHGIKAHSAPGDTVACRECGTTTSHAGEHIESEHEGWTEKKYRTQYPAAPITPRERAELPPPRPNWERVD